MAIGRKRAVILERLLSISLAELRRLNFFDKKERHASLPVSISRRNGLYIYSSTMLITVSTQSGNSYIEFSYLKDGQPLINRIPLVQIENHLTGQLTYYFKCIDTNKLCRKLYQYGDKWVCRNAIPNKHYLQNTLAKNKRGNYESMRRIAKLEKTTSMCSEKWFKAFNKSGQHTSNMKKVIRAKKQLEQINNSVLG